MSDHKIIVKDRKEKVKYSERKMGIKGHLEIFNKDTGELLFSKQNLITDDGLSLFMDRMKDNTENFLTHIAIGTGLTPAAITDTAMETEVSRRAVDNITAGVGTLIVEETVPALEDQFTWKEIGILNAASGGTLFNRINVSFPKGNNNVLIKFTITLTRV